MSFHKRIKAYLFKTSYRTSDGYILNLDLDNGSWTDGDLTFSFTESGFPADSFGQKIEGEVIYPLWFHLFIPFFAIQFFFRRIKNILSLKYHMGMARRSGEKEDYVSALDHIEKAAKLINKL